MTTPAVRTALQRLVASGWPQPGAPAAAPLWVGARPPASRGAILAILPTMLSRFDDPGARLLRREVVAQLAAVAAERPAWLVIGLQHDSDDEQGIRLRLEAELEALRCPQVGISAFSLRCWGKLYSTNVAIAEAERIGADGLLLLDDDITLAPDCLARLVRQFGQMPYPCAVGAVKRGRPYDSRAARLLFRMKSLTRPAMNYPHACCALVSLEVVRGGLSPHHHSDDGQICFRLLRPGTPEPLAALRLIEGAECQHVVGSGWRGTLRRLNRMLHHHAICMADAPYDSARFYFRHMLFHGLWPLAPFDSSHGIPRGMGKLAIKGIYFLWFSVVVGRLALFGAVRQSIGEVAWGSAGSTAVSDK
ncbi:hypothetical protein Q9Q95_13075 [Sphingomonas sp. DG1-23]|uniref:hypothetical protein n=1 Tax=Sphingomonas sp. DG1-23 TaxID=3068316 RepID=UPI00273E7B5C|nr:hypothetical protein [Sphingomonas sp. DG1-23]MDP5279860.1 hypothetical protein [Sphingomonas sp. DG1-23]